jgi:hypothetical protein
MFGEAGKSVSLQFTHKIIRNIMCVKGFLVADPWTGEDLHFSTSVPAHWRTYRDRGVPRHSIHPCLN